MQGGKVATSVSRTVVHEQSRVASAASDALGSSASITPESREHRNNATVSLAAVKSDPEVQSLVRNANRNLGALGYTEHGFRHVGLVANIARNILKRMGYDRRHQELAAISGYLHDIGNVVSRHGHARTSALLAREILNRLGADFEDTAIVMGAIGSHEDEGHVGDPVHAVSAALILADKSDVHRSRVRNTDPTAFERLSEKLRS